MLQKDQIVIIGEFNDDVSRMADEIILLREALKGLDAEIDELKKEIAQKDKEIHRLENE
jgi:hypothetical protein